MSTILDSKANTQRRVAWFTVDLLCQSMESGCLLSSRVVNCRFAMLVDTKVNINCHLLSICYASR